VSQSIYIYIYIYIYDAVVIHWDGKFLSNLTGKGLVDRLTIIASVNGREQLLGVPALNSGTGREQANALYQTIIDWSLGEIFTVKMYKHFVPILLHQTQLA